MEKMLKQIIADLDKTPAMQGIYAYAKTHTGPLTINQVSRLFGEDAAAIFQTYKEIEWVLD
jgi:hypothetical protein